MSQNLPKSLWKFYIKYAARGHWGALLVWGLLFLAVMSEGVLFPNFQRMFIALFEQTPPDGVSFVRFALPTIAIIASTLILLDICTVLRAWARGHWQPKIDNQVSDVLSDYIQHQSMSF